MDRLLSLNIESTLEEDAISVINTNDSSGSETESCSSNGKVRRRGKQRVYDRVKTYETLIEAKKALLELDEIDEDGHWTKSNECNTTEGRKLYYKCFKECNMSAYILVRNDCLDNDVYLSKGEHVHDDHGDQLPPETKKFIIDQYVNNKIRKPFRLTEMVMEKDLPQITIKQMYNLIARIKKKELGQSNCTIGEFIGWCEERSGVPEEDDKVFCVNYEYAIDEATNELLFFRSFLSTKRLLSYTKYNDWCASDGTHKVNYQNFPAIVIGTTDMNKRFHPFGIGLVYGETSDDYEFCYRAILKYNPEYKPRILIADNADAITNAFVSVFKPDNLIRINCWAHVYRRIQLKKDLIKGDKKLKSQITEKEISLIQVSSNKKIFEKSTELFIKKYKHNPNVAPFIEYFESQWVNK
jgi:hypothetical protein